MGEYADEQIEEDNRRFAREAARGDDEDAKALRRAQAPGILQNQAVAFTVHNNGAHLVCHARNGHLVDYWPGPNKWHVRKLGQQTVGAPWKRGFTLKALIKFCKE